MRSDEKLNSGGRAGWASWSAIGSDDTDANGLGPPRQGQPAFHTKKILHLEGVSEEILEVRVVEQEEFVEKSLEITEANLPVSEEALAM